MAAPPIPQRPDRSRDVPAPSASMDIPSGGIRASARRSVDLSSSIDRDSFARSPLNESPFLHKKPSTHGMSSLSRTVSRDLPNRPPSVDFPSIGGEGNEYAQFNQPTERRTSQISPDLPLHAPKAALPAAVAKARVGEVVRTNSYQAAASGIGKASSEAGDHSALPTLTRTTSHQNSRPASVYGKDDEAEHGIPHIGSYIPLFPGAGDVQAPTPTPSQSGYGTPMSGQLKADRHHSRTKSGREVFHGPPGSYGMHGHGYKPTDPLERAWYDKHPAEQARENTGTYSPAIIERKEYTMSSEQLNKLVHTPHQQEGMGASSHVISTPSEQIGYLASEEYTHRLRRLSSQIHDSPLRKAESVHGDGMESETEHDPIHIDPPTRRMKGLEAVGLNPATGPQGAGGEEEQEFDIPILADDEASYRPEARYMQPAVDTPEPHVGRRGSRSNSVQPNRPPMRGDTSTPLDNVKEYEPLFPEDDDDDQTRAAKLHLLKKKRPDLARHHFPSHDVWEDTPESLMYETTVEAEQSIDTAGRAAEHEPSDFFETPEQEKARQQLTKDDQQNFIPKETIAMAKGKLNPDVVADIPSKRPSLRNRFPSQDTWEDTPDSAMYTTVVDEQDDKQDDEEEDASAPQVPARPAGRQAPVVPERPKPQVPARPGAKEGAPLELTKTTSSEREAPALKPKPAVPSRPVGSKIASLQAGFMNDLNNRLKLGPQAPPARKEEPMADEAPSEEEKAPLADARKGRAKGPSRRKPGVSPSGQSTEQKAPPAVRFSMMTCMTVWEIDEDEVVINKPVMPDQTKTDIDTKPDVASDDLPGSFPGEEQPTDIKLMNELGAPAGKASDGHGPASTDSAAQTGEKSISIDDGKGSVKNITAIEGGIAHPAGDAVVEHTQGVEHVSGAEPVAE